MSSILAASSATDVLCMRNRRVRQRKNEKADWVSNRPFVADRFYYQSDVFNRFNLIFSIATWCANHHHITFLFADECTGNR